MRGMLLGLAVMVLGGVARGEVVINNLPGIAPTPTFTANTSSGQFLFSGPNGYKIDIIEFNIKNNGSSILTGGTNFFFKVNFPGLTNSNYLNPGKNLAVGGNDFFVLDLNPFNYVTSGSNQDLIVSFTTNSSGTDTLINTIQFATSSSAPTVASGWSFVTTAPQASSQNIAFALTAVPEPGTLLLGGIAAACGGGGVWWRRKRKPQVAETVESVTAV